MKKIISTIQLKHFILISLIYIAPVHAQVGAIKGEIRDSFSKE